MDPKVKLSNIKGIRIVYEDVDPDEKDLIPYDFIKTLVGNDKNS